ncbi:MAG: AAA family ATPase, partial [Actinomycetota bacterium]|nr:AAA family ATPase [Actinomycetota bacterium]
IVQYQGDGLLVSFGYPRAHEDDARRAVLAGLDIVDAVSGGLTAELPEEVSLSIRIGIHTGLVVLGELGAGSWRQADHVVGEAVNIASRVQAVAEPGSVVITAPTHQLVEGYISVVSVGQRELKGVGRPIELFRALGPSGAQSRLEAMPWRRIALVDREEEEAALRAAWERALRGAADVVLLVGEAGIGKSRLVECFAEQITADATTVTLQCSPYHSSTALSPVVRVLERSAGIRTTDDAGTRWRRVTSFLERVGGLAETDVVLFASLLSIPLPPGEDEPELTAEERREKLLSTLVAWVERTAARRPLLMVVEDLHWADPSTLEFLSRLVERSPAVPLMLLCTTRAEEAAPFADSVRRYRLSPLPPKHRREMVDRLADGRLPEPMLAGVADRSDGIPLYIEELTHSATESTVTGQARGDTAEGNIPPVLADLFTARLEQLPDRGYLAQVVATLGSSVPVSLLALVTGEDETVLLDALGALVDAGVLRSEPSSAEPTYRFRHALLRDAAYHSQLLSQRRALHGRVAEVIEDQLPEMATTRPELLAPHLQHANQPARAAQWWLVAGRQASQLAAHAEAVDHCRQALSVLATMPPEQVPENLELQVQMELGYSLLALRGYTSPEAEEAYRRARDLSAAGDAGRGLVTSYGLWAYYVVRGEHGVSSDLARQAMAEAEASGSADDVVGAAMMLGYQLFFMGELADARRWLERGARGGQAVSSPFPQEPVASSAIVLGCLLLLLGRPCDARRELELALEQAQGVGFPAGPFTRALAHAFAAWFHEMWGDTGEAARHARACIDVSSTYGFGQWLLAGRFHLAIAEAPAGDPVASVAKITEGLALWRAGGAELFRSYFLAGLAKAHRCAGDVTGAIRAVDEALVHVDRFGERFYAAELHRLRAELLLIGRDPSASEAEAELRAALDVARHQQARWFELRATASLHELYVTQGRGAETESALRSLVAEFVEIGSSDLPDVRRAQDLLALSV